MCFSGVHHPPAARPCVALRAPISCWRSLAGPAGQRAGYAPIGRAVGRAKRRRLWATFEKQLSFGRGPRTLDKRQVHPKDHRYIKADLRRRPLGTHTAEAAAGLRPSPGQTHATPFGPNPRPSRFPPGQIRASALILGTHFYDMPSIRAPLSATMTTPERRPMARRPNHIRPSGVALLISSARTAAHVFEGRPKTPPALFGIKTKKTRSGFFSMAEEGPRISLGARRSELQAPGAHLYFGPSASRDCFYPEQAGKPDPTQHVCAGARQKTEARAGIAGLMRQRSANSATTLGRTFSSPRHVFTCPSLREVA